MAAAASVLGFNISVQKNSKDSKHKYSVYICREDPPVSLQIEADSFREALMKASKFIKVNI